MPTLKLLICAALFLSSACGRRVTADEAIQEREVTFTGAGGLKLAGTLTLPAHSAGVRSPGLILIAGSGPTDRDGNQLPQVRTDLLKQFAATLAHQGVASFRYDKRVTGATRATLPHDMVKLGDFCAWENFVDDAIAAFRSLQQQPEIDSARTGMLGHSEGGLIVLQAADRIKAQPHPCAALALVSTPGRPLGQVLHDQLARILRLQQASADQTKFFLDKSDQIVVALKGWAHVPDDVPPGLAALYPGYLGKFLHSEFNLSPTELAAKFTGPVLVLQGEKDVQILAQKDAPGLDAALKSRAKDDHELHIVPGASHCMKLVNSEIDPGFEGPALPDALQTLGGWLKTTLRAQDPR